jgi:hypothetical protein
MSASEAIARLRELRAKATAGEWESGAEFDSDFRDILNADGDSIAYGFASSGTGILRPQDSAAIVAAMNSLDSLLECAEALADLSSWFTTPQVGGQVWMIPAGKRGADDAVKQARAALDALGKGGGE